jgi:hypothetical protein
MRTGNVPVFLVPPPIPIPGKLCRPRGRHRLRPQKGFPAHPILTVADHDFTRYPLTLVTTHLLDDRGMLPDTCHAAKAAECAQGDNCTALLTLLLLTLAPMQPSRTVVVVGRLTGPWQSTDLGAGSGPNGHGGGHARLLFLVTGGAVVTDIARKPKGTAHLVRLVRSRSTAFPNEIETLDRPSFGRSTPSCRTTERARLSKNRSSPLIRALPNEMPPLSAIQVGRFGWSPPLAIRAAFGPRGVLGQREGWQRCR